MRKPSQEFDLYVEGQWIPAVGRETFGDVNPADIEDVVGIFPKASAEDTAGAIEAAWRAYRAWKLTPQLERGDYLRRAADRLEGRAEEVAAQLCRENGKTIGESRGEVKRAVAILRYFAGAAAQPMGETVPSTSADTLLFTVRDPIGVVGVITPWNFPLAIPMWKIAPALLYGNTVVFKPSKLAPATGHVIAQIFDSVGVPAGVLNLLTGDPSVVGNAIVDNELVRAVTFTGSNRIGRQIEHRVHEHGGKVQLEMGGKNPIIVLDDADLESAVDITVSGAMRMAGQKCTATSRAIIAEGIYPQFHAALIERVRTLKVGNPIEEDVYLGPVISREQHDTVLKYIEVGRQEGGRIMVGGTTLEGRAFDRGYFVAPTVMDQVEAESTLGQNEIFGPVLGLIKVSSVEEAIQVANSVRYGLSASICTRDLNRVLQFVREAEAGVIKVNSETAGIEYQVPFGGMKESSSFSREQGTAAREFFTQIKTVYIDPARG